MPVITITKTYADGTTLFEADLDHIKDDLENFLNVTKINDDNIQNAGITASSKLVDATVSSAKLASASVTTSKINDAAVTTTKIADASISTAKIIDASISTAKIIDASVTQAKRASLGQQVSSSAGIINVTSLVAVDLAGLSVTITTTGRPVFVGLFTKDANVGNIRASKIAGTVSSAAPGCSVQFVRGATVLSVHPVQITKTSTTADIVALSINAPNTLYTIDIPAAGTYIYKVQAFVANADSEGQIGITSLIAYEL